jgi:hypothetical protein
MAEEIIDQSSTMSGGVEPTLGVQPVEQEPLDITVKQSKNVLTKLVDGLANYAAARSEWEQHWRESQDIYEGSDGADSQWPYSSRYEIPEAFRQTEGQKALIVNAFFGQPKWFEFDARHHGHEEDANVASHICRWQIKNFDLEDEIMTWPSEVVHYGVSYCTYGWSQFKRLRFKFSQDGRNDEFNETWRRETIEEIHGAPFVEYLSPWKVFHHPLVDRVAQSPVVYIVENVSGDYLLSQMRHGFFDQKCVMRALEKRNNIPSDLAPELWEKPDRELLGDPEFELITAYTNGGRVYSIINREEVVQAQENAYGETPVLSLRNYQSPGNAYGISEPKQLQTEQALIRDLSSMAVDSIFFKLQPMWLYSPELQRYFGDQDFAFKPGMAMQAENPATALVPTTTTNEAAAIFAHAETVRGHAQLKTNYTDIVSGSGPQGVKTAFQHERLQSAASARLETRIIMWEPRIRKLYEALHRLNAQFLNERIALRIDGMNGGSAYGRYKDGSIAYQEQPLASGEVTEGFGPESFETDIDVEVVLPRTMGTPMERQQRLLTLWGAISQDPRWAHEIVMEEMGRAFEFKNPKRLIVRPGYEKTSALKENADFFAYGVLPDVLQTEDHQSHLEAHAYVPQMQQFNMLNDSVRAKFIMHVEAHAKYLQQIQAMQMQQGGSPEQTGDTASPDVRSASSGLAEASSGPGEQGAMQQGAIKR